MEQFPQKGSLEDASHSGISASGFKWIAAVTMTIDHIGCVLYPQYLILRIIGRAAFPIYCFLLGEGFRHTSDPAAYAKRLLICAIAAEIPFDLAFSHMLFDFTSQNVIWTLLFAFLVLWASQQLPRLDAFAELPQAEQEGICLLLLMAAMMAGELLSTDYGAFGVFLAAENGRIKSPWKRSGLAAVLLLLHYLIRNPDHILVGCWFGLSALSGVLLTLFYSGAKGRRLPKHLSYLFYPLHLFIIYLISVRFF